MIQDARSHVSISGPATFSGPPLVDGLVWRDEWRGPCEGALTLLWKIALANCLTPQELCIRLFGKRLLVSDPYGMHGRTLLTPNWMNTTRVTPAVLGQMIRRCGLDMASAGWASIVASDNHIRYCKACMTDGYQSVYCQIDGLLTCPVHGLPLLEACTECGTPTPRYALTGLTMSNPYCCHACGEPYGERLWNPTADLVSHIYNDEQAAYHVLEQWISDVENFDLSWPYLSTWQCCREGQQGEIERKIAVFAILAQLVSLPMKRAYLREPTTDISMSAHRVIGHTTLTKLNRVDAADKLNSKRDAYVAIRRHIWQILFRHHRRCLRAGSKALHIEWGNEVLQPIDPVCPLVFAFFLWRHHFESNITISSRIGTNNRKLTLRDEALSWPVDWEVETTAWCTFVIMSFFSFVQVAKEWGERIEQFTAPYKKANHANFMQLLAEFRISLSPRYMAWTSRVTTFSSRQLQPSDEGSVVIVGPVGRLRDMLLQHPCAINPHSVMELKSGLIQPHFDLLKISNLKKPEHADQKSELQIHIAPLDRLKVLPELDGHAFTSRRNDLGNIETMTDIEAVRLWLHEYEGNSSTFRSYQKAVEILINWALVERRKPMSALNESDIVAFEEFLANPQPRSRWISKRGTSRSDHHWTPLVGPLSPRTRLQTLTIIRLMFDWLSIYEYRDVFKSHWRHSNRSYNGPSSLRLIVAQDKTPNIIGVEDWHLLKNELSNDEGNDQYLYSRLAIELMYFGSLSISEVANIHVSHIIRSKHATLLRIPSRSAELSTIYLLPPVTLTLERLGIIGTTAASAFTCDGADTAADESDPSQRLFMTSTRNISNQIKGAFHRAAHVAIKEGNIAAASRLKLLTAYSLRNAFEWHAKEFNATNWIWPLIGAARLLPVSSRCYLPRRKELSEYELQSAIRSLSSCLYGS